MAAVAAAALAAAVALVARGLPGPVVGVVEEAAARVSTMAKPEGWAAEVAGPALAAVAVRVAPVASVVPALAPLRSWPWAGYPWPDSCRPPVATAIPFGQRASPAWTDRLAWPAQPASPVDIAPGAIVATAELAALVVRAVTVAAVALAAVVASALVAPAARSSWLPSRWTAPEPPSSAQVAPAATRVATTAGLAASSWAKPSRHPSPEY